VPRDIEVSCEAQGELPPVHGHYDALLRAFRNILRNAVEAMESVPGPHRLSVTIGTEDRAGSPIHSMGGAVDWLRVTVADTGPGIPEALGDRIFEPDCTTKSSGTGLGLALVRQAVAVHGGEVTAHNSAEGGAVFTVRLPGMVAAHVPQVAG
jgi:signal transduction histidine kinase